MLATATAVGTFAINGYYRLTLLYRSQSPGDSCIPKLRDEHVEPSLTSTP
jgi:hypothetical protein